MLIQEPRNLFEHWNELKTVFKITSSAKDVKKTNLSAVEKTKKLQDLDEFENLQERRGRFWVVEEVGGLW